MTTSIDTVAATSEVPANSDITLLAQAAAPEANAATPEANASTASTAAATAAAPALGTITGATAGVKVVRGGNEIPVDSALNLLEGDKVVVPKDGSANVTFPGSKPGQIPINGVFSGGSEAVIGTSSPASGIQQVTVDMVQGDLFVVPQEALERDSVAVRKKSSGGGAGLAALGLLGLAGLAGLSKDDENGPTGPTGDQGLVGATGATGEPGATGPAGPGIGLLDQDFLDTVSGVTGNALDPVVGAGGLAGDAGTLDNLLAGVLVDQNGLILNTDLIGGGGLPGLPGLDSLTGLLGGTPLGGLLGGLPALPGLPAIPGLQSSNITDALPGVGSLDVLTSLPAQLTDLLPSAGGVEGVPVVGGLLGSLASVGGGAEGVTGILAPVTSLLDMGGSIPVLGGLLPGGASSGGEAAATASPLPLSSVVGLLEALPIGSLLSQVGQ